MHRCHYLANGGMLRLVAATWRGPAYLLASASFCHNCAATSEAILLTSNSACTVSGQLQTSGTGGASATGAGLGNRMGGGLVLFEAGTGSGAFSTGCGSCGVFVTGAGLGIMLARGLGLFLGGTGSGALRTGCGSIDAGAVPCLGSGLGTGLLRARLGVGLAELLSGAVDCAGTFAGEGLRGLTISATAAGLDGCGLDTGVGNGSALLYLGP